MMRGLTFGRKNYSCLLTRMVGLRGHGRPGQQLLKPRAGRERTAAPRAPSVAGPRRADAERPGEEPGLAGTAEMWR